MNGKNNRFEFTTLLFFLLVTVLLLSNGFIARIFAQEGQVDVYQHIEPIGVVLGHILDEHVYDPDLDKLHQAWIDVVLRRGLEFDQGRALVLMS